MSSERNLSSVAAPLRTAVTFAHGHRAAQGHFPGNPIIPGAALLDEALAAVATAHGMLGRCTRLKTAKFLLPVRPGDRMEIVARATPEGMMRIDASVADKAALVAVARYVADGPDLAARATIEPVASLHASDFQPDISALLPHAAPMSLLARIVDWDNDRLRSLAVSHRDPDNPLARGARLCVICAIEYAAQAMALHGALTQHAATKPRGALLAAVRDVTLHARYLDGLAADLFIEVERLVGDSTGVLYRFRVSAAGPALVEGRATVMLDLGI
jgi:predicted hotdog family 3-hydroxylacyl-ACP dehydratase